jgi:protein-L-isoaspartate(D-aspartate) O-methyltransferase
MAPGARSTVFEMNRRVWCAAAAACLSLLPLCETSADEATFERARLQMVERQLKGRDITDATVLRAMARVPRHRFVSPALASQAYTDRALPIEEGQTISQPYIVALMTQLLELTGSEKVLEVGTGSGYQAAVLAELGVRVYTIEILPGLASRAADQLKALGYTRITVRAGDGYQGWPEAAPFDAVAVTAGATRIPEPLVAQLAEGGRLVIPVGPTSGTQALILGRKTGGRLVTRVVIPVRFVPLVEPRR